MDIKFYDVVKKSRLDRNDRYDISFPKIEQCECGGVRYIIHEDKIDNPLLALEISLAKFGHDEYKGKEPTACHLLLENDVPVFSDEHATLIFCPACHGYTGFSDNTGYKKDGWKACKYAYINYGAYAMSRTANPVPQFRICNCENELVVLKNKIKEFPFIDYGKWELSSTSNVRRGIRDYFRIITFERDLSNIEMKTLLEWLRKDKCPGWTGVRYNRKSKGIYLFSTTWDSSD
jgi:hypothetical protein